jgi:endonuclease YncB( thermonuclease family)
MKRLFKRPLNKEDKIAIVISSIILVAILILALLFFFYHSNDPYSVFFQNNTVINVIDGDTFEYVQITDTNKWIITVRLLCVDTPEVNQTGYQEAKDYLSSLILNKQIKLIPSNKADDKDSYGRELRYIYVDNTFVNKQILNNKYGELLIIPPEDCAIVK